MGDMLVEVSRNEASQGRGPLSVIVVRKHGDMEPGNGFHGLAESMGLNISDRTACCNVESMAAKKPRRADL
jgi:hypothetical protein